MNIKFNFLKLNLALLILCFGLFYSCNQPTETTTKNPSGFEIKRGVNLSHWLSQDFGWAPKYTYIQEKDIRFIDSIGYDHVRIPIDEHEMWDEEGNQIAEAFDHLLACLEWCEKYDLRAIVDLHIIRAHHFNAENDGTENTLWNDEEAQQGFLNLWVQLSDKLHMYPNNMVAYELLNEAVAPDHADWTKLVKRGITTIREKEPNRVLIIGSNSWQSPKNLKYLELPENDKNIILSFHTYTPLGFTHHTAEWTAIKVYTGPVHYPGKIIKDEDYYKYIDTTNMVLVGKLKNSREVWTKEKLAEVFESGLEFAKSMNLQLYCGEFGCLPTVPREDRLQYYSDFVSAFEENNIAWCNWEYKGDFGVYHWDKENLKSLEPDTSLIHILLGEK